MKNWTSWLYSKGLADTSVEVHMQSLRYIKEWAEVESLDYQYLNYREIMDYVRFSQEKGIAIATINNRLNSLTHYFAYLQDEGLREDNPARKIRVKDIKARIKNILPKKELEQLFKVFPSGTSVELRDKVMLGLLIFQGCDTGTMKAIKTHDVNLDEGSILLPATKRGNARNLPLNPSQMILMHRYLATRNSEKFFSIDVNNGVELLKHKLKKINSKVESVRQLRASVIVAWLKTYNLREVQYLAGHRSILATENYLMQDVEELKKSLEGFHPLSG